jgi:hypothetical protein
LRNAASRESSGRDRNRKKECIAIATLGCVPVQRSCRPILKHASCCRLCELGDRLTWRTTLGIESAADLAQIVARTHRAPPLLRVALPSRAAAAALLSGAVVGCIQAIPCPPPRRALCSGASRVALLRRAARWLCAVAAVRLNTSPEPRSAPPMLDQWPRVAPRGIACKLRVAYARAAA